MMTYTDRRRFPILLTAIAALALAWAMSALLFSTVEAQNVPEGTTDLPAGTSTTGVVEVDGAVRGTINEPFDDDWFAVTLVADGIYRVDIQGGHLIDDDGNFADPELTLILPELVGIYDAGGALFSNTSDRSGSGPFGGARSFFTPEAGGTYYISASGVSDSVGGYELTVTDVTDNPDHYEGPGRLSGGHLHDRECV